MPINIYIYIENFLKEIYKTYYVYRKKRLRVLTIKKLKT